jgi:hypothetical protein
MTLGHPPSHEQVLQRVATADLSLQCPEVEQLIQDCSICREELSRWQQLADSLEDYSAEMHQVRSLREEPDEPRVRDHLRTLGAPGQPDVVTRASSRRWWLQWLAAAAVLLLLFWWGSRPAAETAPDVPRFLGTEARRCLGPVGPVLAYEEFRWQGERPAGGWFELEILAVSAEPGAAEVDHREFSIHVPRLTEPVWRPTAEQLPSLPSAIFWKVTWYDASGQPCGQAQAEAERIAP